MKDGGDKSSCGHCGHGDPLQVVGERLLRCGACAFVFPQSITSYGLTDARDRQRVAALAPEGLLRGKYRLVARLGEGAHGVSYLADHEYLSHPCVVKILPYRVGEASDAAVMRLKGEARAGFRVNDPHVVRVLDCDAYRGNWYFVMEYVPGGDLSLAVRHEIRLCWQQAVQVGVDAARGLTAIHHTGLVHRDIKPSNLILGMDGQLRVADLGVAGLAHEHADSGNGGHPEGVGTLAYAAPETLATGVAVGPSADLYSLGATLYHLVTGSLPHRSTQVFQRLIDLQCRPVSWPVDAPADVPDWFVAAILRLLAIEPEQRPESTIALIESLSSPTEAVQVSVPAPPLETLEARGVGVLPFEKERGSPDDEWLGYALANFLSRALAEMPGVYVADQDGLTALLARMPSSEPAGRHEQLLRAGRMAGAGTIVTGRFRRAGDRLDVEVVAHRSGAAGSRTVAQVEGRLSDLTGLEQELLRRLAAGLGIALRAGEAPAAPRRPALAAREKLVLARRAYLGGVYDRAIALAREAVELDPQFAEAIGLIGVCCGRLGRYEEAAEHHRRQEALAEELGDGRLRIEALANLGVMYYFRGDYEAAEPHYARAAEAARELGLAVEEAQICNNLGFVLFRRGRLAEAEGAFLRAIETHRAYGGLTALIGPYSGLGNVLVEQGRYAEARTYYRRALALAEEIGDRTIVGTTHMHLGRCAALEERFAEAKHEFTMALNALEETRFWNGLARAYEYIADLHMQLGNHDEVIRCADKRIELARQHSNLRIESAAWMQKAESLKRAGRAEEAAACLARGSSAEQAAAAKP